MISLCPCYYREGGFSLTKKLLRSSKFGVKNCTGEPENGINAAETKGKRTLVVERYNNEDTKRYLMDDQSRLQITCQMQQSNQSSRTSTDLLFSSTLKDFILPEGFPGSVSDDYIEYMLWQFPTNVTAWICRTLVTSSLLKAVGVGSWQDSTVSAATTAAASAAIKWVSRDGIGALGRLFIGGRFGGLFDNDPKQWRMYADFIGSAGSIFELATPLIPEYFLPLASIGNLTKAIARGLKDPSFRVIQNHFAIAGNLGDVAAKEEVWEVGGQIVGLVIGVLILTVPGLVTSYPKLALTWTSLRLLHLWLRYQSLARLRFSTINLKRARILVESYILNVPIPGLDECNKKESILILERLLRPSVRFGCSIEMLIGPEASCSQLEALLDLYKKEKYILVLHSSPYHGKEARVAFKVGATSVTVLRSLWQTYWLYIKSMAYTNDKKIKTVKDFVYCIDDLKASLLEMDKSFDEFLFHLQDAGWDIKQLVLKVPTQVTIIEKSVEENV